ncbi:MAG: hypothetical protein IKJ16_00500 [Agathobacter sp.]|nr:hypothetical protein [Agathobacter sp.]
MCKKYITMLICIISIVFMFTGCSYVAYKDYYSDVDDYIEIWDLTGFRFREQGISPFFPQSIDDLDVREFFCRYDQQLPLGEGVQLFLEVQYKDELLFNEELERIKSMSFNCDELFKDSMFSAYVTSLEKHNSLEYALIDEEQQVIYYIYLQSLPKDEIEFDLKYVPVGYTGYGEVNKD